MAREAWSSGERYEPFVGRWSRLVVAELIDWLRPGPGLRWADVGCGTGVVTGALLDRTQPAWVVGVDRSRGYLRHAAETLGGSCASFTVGDACDLPLPATITDGVVCGLLLNFVTDASRAAHELRRVARPGATVAAYVWDYSDGMQLLRFFWDAAVALDPGAVELDEGRRFPLCHRDALGALFADAGFAAVDTREVVVPTVFRDVDDYWTPFLGGEGPAPGYCVSLPAAERERLRARLLSALPVRDDGSVHLTARAWAVRGTA